MKNNLLLFALVALLILSRINISLAQHNSDTTIFSQPTKTHHRLNSGLGKEVFSGKRLAIFGATLGGAILMDKWVSNQFQSHQNKGMKHFTDVATVFGEKKIMVPATAAIWAAGLCLKNERLSTTAFNSCKALITGGLLVEAIKIGAGRSRPDTDRGPWHYNAFGGINNSTKSLPSGHAFVSWAIFTPFAQEYSKWLYAIPVSVSIARMYRNRHWFSDVVLGSGIGYFAGLYFQKRKNQKIIYTGNGIVIRF